MNKQKITQLVALSMLSTTLAAPVSSMAANKVPMEKCYGVAKAGKNDCGTKSHACAEQAKTDNDPNEWKFVKKGECKKMGGQLSAP